MVSLLAMWNVIIFKVEKVDLDFDSPIVKHGKSTYNGFHRYHCGHTTPAIQVSSLIPVFRHLSHVQFLHLIIDKCPEMLGFRLIFVSNSHCLYLALNLYKNFDVACLGMK